MRLPPPIAVLALAWCGACGGGGDAAGADALAAAVGRLAQGDQVGPCHATLIGPDRALTAAHCVVDLRTWRPSSQPPNGIRLRVVVGNRAFPVLDAVVPEERALSPSGEILDLRHDWTVLRVAVEEGAAPPPFLPLAGERAARLAFVLAEAVIEVGIRPAEDGRGTTVDQARCRIDAIEPGGGLLGYRCDGGTGPGASGSPLLRQTGDGGYEVIGVVSARARSGPAGEVGFVVIPPTGD